MIINQTIDHNKAYESICLIFNYKILAIACIIIFLNIISLSEPYNKLKKYNKFKDLSGLYELKNIKKYIKYLKNNNTKVKIYLNKGKKIYNIKNNKLLNIQNQNYIWSKIKQNINTCNGIIIKTIQNNKINYQYFPLNLKDINQQFQQYNKFFAGSIDYKITKFISRLDPGVKLNIYRKINNNIYQIDANTSSLYLNNNKQYILDYININHYMNESKITKINNYCYALDNCSLLELIDKGNYTYIIINHSDQNLNFYHSLSNIMNFNYLLNKIKNISKSTSIQNQICYILNYIIKQKDNDEPIINIKERKITEHWSTYSINNLSFLIYNNKVFSLII